MPLSKKSSLLLVIASVLGIITYFYVRDESAPSESQRDAAKPVESAVAKLDEANAPAVDAEPEQVAEKANDHSADCAHCAAAQKTSADAEPQLLTNPAADPIFKQLARMENKVIPINTFDFLRGSQVGAEASFNVGELQFQGQIALVRENHPQARTYGINLDDDLGRVLVKTDAGGFLTADLFFMEDSRIITAREVSIEGQGRVLKVEESTVDKVICATPGTILTANGFSSWGNGTNTSLNASEKELPAPTLPVDVPLLESRPDSEYVIFLDFDGALITGTDWNLLTGGPIDAAPMPRAGDDLWINLIWQRVAEDFAPFEINVTTDEAVFNAPGQDPTKRLHVVMTSTNWRGSGGVAYLNSFREDTPVCWVFNDSEYTCATTISHEAGHTFGLEHDGFGVPGNTDYLEYYPGHNGSYAPGWAPIMGAGFGNLPYDEVDQWSSGDYANSSQKQDDLAIIGDDVDPQITGGGISNGFGFKADDYANAYDQAGLGTFEIVGDNLIESSGLISTTGDKDVFQFSAPAGALRFVVTTLDVNSVYGELGSGTAGSNLAANTQLIDASGNVLAEGEPTGANQLNSILETSVDEGVYFLLVDGGGRGDGPDTGFSDYGSLGEYTISGELALPPLSVSRSKPPVTIFNGSTSVSAANGTSFGFTTPGQAVTNTFLLANSGGSGVITDLQVSIAPGSSPAFSLGQTPSGTIQEGTLGQELEIIYNPSSSGTDSATIRITYTALSSRVFEFAVRGTATGAMGNDNYENNDNANIAYNLNPYEDVWLDDIAGLAFFMSDQDDWYTFTAGPDDNIIRVDVEPSPETQNVFFELVNFNGAQYEIVARTTGGRMQFIIPESYDAARRKFYVHASTTSNSTVRNPYDLRWSSIELAGLTDDLYEENDIREEAFNLTFEDERRLTSILGLGTSKDEDWYRLDVSADRRARMLYVAATFDETDGNIDIELYRGAGRLDFSIGGGDKEVITYSEPVLTENYATSFSPTGNTDISGVEPGTYYVRVIGDFAGNTYDLVFDTLSDDKYETIAGGAENDTFANAFDLGESIIGNLLSEIDGQGSNAAYLSEPDEERFVNGPDEDWYKFNIPDGINLEQVSLDYQTESFVGQLRFAIHDADGEELVRTQDGSVDPGTLEVNNPQGTIFYIRVISPSNIDNLSNYDFRVNISEEPPFIVDPQEDNYEENDTFQELFNISSNEGRYLSSLDGYGFQLDPDWYGIQVPSTAARVEASLVFINSDGDLDLTLSKKDGPVHFRSSNGTNTESIVWENPIPGQYALTVTGPNRGNFYNLLWDITFSEDNYEENDSFTQFFDLTGFENRLLNKLDGIAIQADDDWYKISATADTVELRAAITFAHNEGDIDLALYNAGGSLIARSITTTSNESLVYNNPPAGDYFLRVYYDDAANEYDLTWSAVSQDELDLIPDGDDSYEENDSIASPYVLADTERRLSILSGLGIQKDEDWYEIEVPDGNTGILVECLFTDSLGDIDFEIYDPLGFPLALRDSIDDNELFTLNTPIPQGKYKIRVYGPNLGNDYDLYWNPFIEDIFEENDVSGEAYDITLLLGNPLSSQGIATLSDDDWYKFTVSADRPFVSVELEYNNIDGAIDFELLDSSLNVIAVANSLDDFDSVLAEVTNGEIYYVRVYGDNRYNTYDLTVAVIGDDQYEENDVSGDAEDITSLSPIQAVQFDDDWFVFTVTNPNNFLAVNASFIHANGNVDIFLYESSDLINPIASSTTDQDSESLRVEGTAGTYYIKVTGDNTNTAYQLFWTVSPDDEFEQNDTLGEAEDISGQEGVELEAIQFDEDWFEISVDPGKISLLVELSFLHSEGNLSLSLYDSAGVELEVVNTGDDNEVIEYSVFPFGTTAETYYIKVDGVNAGTTYTLRWQTSIEDTFEGETGNNSYFTASEDLLSSEGQRISQTVGYGGALNDDWYKVRINSGDLGVVIEALFQHSATTNIDLELFDSNRTFVARSGGFSDVERLDYRGPAGTYFLRVFGKSGDNPYDLVWNSYSEGSLEIVNADPNPDIENDQPNTPKGIAGDPDLEFFRIENQTQLDEDWFSVFVAPGEDIFIIDMEFEHIYGDIDVAVYDQLGNLVEQAESETDGEQIRVNDLPPGPYLICVYGYGIYNPKSAPGWLPNSFDPFAEDYSELDIDRSPYDLAEEDGSGLGNTYMIRWISTNDDRFDIETPIVGDVEINDSFETAAVPELIDQEGQLDSDGVIDDELRTIQKTNQNGDLVNVPYRPVYTYGGLRQLDDDWYQFTVDLNDGQPFYVAMFFNNAQANLDLFVYDSGNNLLDSSESDSSGEFLTLTGSGEVTYYLKVTGENLGTPYSLEVRGFLDDVYEENDTLEQADTELSNLTDPDNNLAGITLTGLVKRDEDLFRVDIPEDYVHLNVFAYSALSPLGIGVEVLDAEGNSLAEGYYQTRVIAPVAGTYYLRIGDESPLVTYNLFFSYDNNDEYDQKISYESPPGSGEFVSDNDLPERATLLSRGRIEPPTTPAGGIPEIQELAFDYDLITSTPLVLSIPWFDPFGHAIQEADDWYALQVPSWELTQAQRWILNLISGEPELQNIPVLKRLYYARLSVEIEFEHVDGNIDLELYTENDLANPIARSASPNDIESIIVPIDPRDEGLFYFIRVYGDDNANDYSLKWSVSFDDYYEELEDDLEGNDTNDFVDMAYDLTSANGQSTEGIPLHEIQYAQDVNKDGVIDAADGGFTSATGFGIQRTDDWYAVVVSDGATDLQVEAKFYSDNDTGYIYEPDNLDIDFEVYYLAETATPNLRKPVLIGRSIEDTDNSIFVNDGFVAYREDSGDVQLTTDVTREITESATFDVSGTGPGIYFIRIYYDNRSHPYTFTWDDIGDISNAGDAAIIDDYLNGGWSFDLSAGLPADQVVDASANLDGDRFPNYAEFALGMDTSVADYAVIGQSISEIEGKNYYQFEFVRNIEAKALGYEFIVQESDSLSFGAKEAVYVRSEPVPGRIGVERVIYRCSKPMDEQDKCFFRLVVNEPPAAATKP